MPNTPNFNWPTPADTDYVTNGALAMRDLGDGIDETLVDLKGGTTGQVLAKASGTDMDFAWTTPNPGDVTAVNVTSPLTGGGTGGDVTVGIQDGTTTQKGAVQLEDSTSSTSTTKAATPNSVKSAYDLANGAIPKSLVDAAGDLLVGTADNTVGRLAKGTANQVLKVNSGGTALEWGTASGGGKVLQVVSATYSTSVSTSSATYSDTGLTATITPSATTSKVLVIVNHNGLFKSGNLAGNIRLMANGSAAFVIDSLIGYDNSAGFQGVAGGGATYLHSPATTSAVIYKTQFASDNGASFTINGAGGGQPTTSTITLMEIGA